MNSKESDMKSILHVKFLGPWIPNFFICFVSTEWPQTELKESGIKSTLHMDLLWLWLNFKVPQIFQFSNFGKSPKHLYSVMTALFIIKCYENWVSSGLENLNIGNFAKSTKWPQSELKESDMKSTLHEVPRTTSAKFSSISLYDESFSGYCTLYDFSLTPMLKFQSVLFFGRSPKYL